MASKVRIPTPLRKLTQGQQEVPADGKTIGEVFKNLENKYPGIKERICDETGSVRRFVNVYINEEDIRFLKNLESAVKDGDEISIVPAIAGGAAAQKVIKKKVYLTFPSKQCKEPLIYLAGHKFKIVTNIRGANISDEIGIVALEMDGAAAEIEKAIEFFQAKGLKVEPIEMNVIE